MTLSPLLSLLSHSWILLFLTDPNGIWIVDVQEYFICLIDLHLKVDKSGSPQIFKPDRIEVPLIKIGKLDRTTSSSKPWVWLMLDPYWICHGNSHHPSICES